LFFECCSAGNEVCLKRVCIFPQLRVVFIQPAEEITDMFILFENLALVYIPTM
jgi:hypothetical protein